MDHVLARWIRSSEDARMIFVVPSHIYYDFRKQNYLTSEGKVYQTQVPANIEDVKQYALMIDLESAAAGQSPGMEVPVPRNPPRTGKRQ
jgi:hypothetical protein